VVLALGAQGGVVLIGRGAGCILPADSTLNVRVVAPLADRIAYMGQWLRLTEAEAAERVRLRDQRRAEFIDTHFHRRPDDVHQYHLVLNSSFLGEELCAELIARAARERAEQFGGRTAVV
jgi:cytidylate kinase